MENVRSELVDHLAFLAQQAATPKDLRNPGAVRTIMARAKLTCPR